LIEAIRDFTAAERAARNFWINDYRVEGETDAASIARRIAMRELIVFSFESRG